MAAAVQHGGLAAHAQHAQGEEGFRLHVSVQRQNVFENKMQFQVSHSILRLAVKHNSVQKVDIFRNVVEFKKQTNCTALNFHTEVKNIHWHFMKEQCVT